MPSIRKGEHPEQFRARVRDYMERRARKAGRAPERRIPREDAGRMVEAWRRRADYLKSAGGFWPERSFRPVFIAPGRGESRAKRVRGEFYRGGGYETP